MYRPISLEFNILQLLYLGTARETPEAFRQVLKRDVATEGDDHGRGTGSTNQGRTRELELGGHRNAPAVQRSIVEENGPLGDVQEIDHDEGTWKTDRTLGGGKFYFRIARERSRL